MAEERQTGPGFTGNNWILLAVALVGAVYAWLQVPPLEGVRPIGPGRAISDDHGIQDVDARLWQDPLSVVKDADERDKKEWSPNAHQFKKLGLANSSKRPLILGISVPGGPYAEDSEVRRRLRYAVIAGLRVNRYVPEDGEHIGYVRVDDRNDSAPLPQVIPFEWFTQEDDPADEAERRDDKILVLWIDELALGKEPIKSLARLLCGLRSHPDGLAKDFALIGPVASTTLKAMVKELIEDGEIEAPSPPCPTDAPAFGALASKVLDGLSIYNFAATIDQKTLLLNTAEDATSNDEPISELFHKINVDYYRPVSSDRALAKVLVKELAQRGIKKVSDGKKLTPDSHHIALVSEWDTIYGRTLPRLMYECLSYLNCERPEQAEPTGAREKLRGWQWIHRYSYLRGLDGVVPRPKESKTSNSSEEGTDAQAGDQRKSAPESDAAANRERAIGQGQFDYLRRLAHLIRTEDQQWELHGEGRIAAIGVLGSDIYDKLLILQALRPGFPDVLFFTTDLDALLFPQGKQRQTRNLLVASSFDLNLRRERQGNGPPFRSTYQTSIFLATQLAIQNARSGSDTRSPPVIRSQLSKWLEPRIFEIGRNGPYALPVEADLAKGDDPRACRNDILKCKYIQPKLGELFPEVRESWDLNAPNVSILFIATVLTVGLAMCSRTLREFCLQTRRYGHRLPWLTSSQLARLLSFVLIILVLNRFLVRSWPQIGDFLTERGLGEPMLLLEGISLWPPIFLRVASIGLCLWLIWLTLHSLQKNLEDTATAMQLGSVSPPRIWRPFALWLSETLSLRPIRHDPPPNGQLPVILFDQLWGPFIYAHRRVARMMRAGLAVIAVLIAFLALTVILGKPNTPARGNLAGHLYLWVTLIDVMLTWFLIFLVADATWYSRSFIEELRSVRLKWPKETVQEFGKRLGLKDSMLDDWIDLQFLARRTRCITNLIYFPFIMLTLLIISRSPVFDNFRTPPTVIIAQLVVVAIIIGSVIALRRAAEAKRANVIENLTNGLIAVRGEGNAPLAAQLELMLNRVENLRDGAFAPWSSQPTVRAFLLPLLTYAATAAAHTYALPGL